MSQFGAKESEAIVAVYCYTTVMAVTLGFVLRVDQPQAVAVPPLLPPQKTINVRPDPEIKPASVATSPEWPRPASGHLNMIRETYDFHGKLGENAQSAGNLLDTYA
ncbi:MAG: hypothetical protein ACE5DY_06990 [Mariprofundaceae bacterium]